MAPASRPHILVVDDDPSIHEALTAALGHLYVVHAAASGAEACGILGSQPIAAIILDAILRDEHGLDLVERLRALAPLPILLLTGHSSEDLAIRALRAKVDDYLKKPPGAAGAVRRPRPPHSPDAWPGPIAAGARGDFDGHPAWRFWAAALIERPRLSESHAAPGQEIGEREVLIDKN